MHSLSPRRTSRFGRIVLCVFLLLCSSVPAFADYRTFEIESLRITIDSDWPTQGAPGYLPVRFDITNLGDAREIEIVATGERYFDPYRRGRTVPGPTFGGMQQGTSNFSQTIQLKRGDRAKLTVPLPTFADNENFQFHLRENGRPLTGFSSYVSVQSGRPFNEAPVLLAVNPASPLGLMAVSWPRPMTPASGRMRFIPPPASGSGRLPPLDFLLDPQRLPTNWLGYTSLRAVLLGPMEWNQLNAAQREALLTWTATGGDLLLVDGTLETVLPASPLADSRPATSSGRPYFLGHIHLLSSADITTHGLKAAIDTVNAAVANPDWALPANRAMDWGWMRERGFRLPIEGAGGVPSRAYLSMLVLFVALIGPVNYIYLWRKRMQVFLVITVPLISGCFILLLTGYGLLLEGFGVRGRAMSFTVLDQEAKHAATRSSVTLYRGGVTRAGLRFATDVAVFPVGSDGLGPRGLLSLDLTGAQRFTSGLLSIRAPSNFEEAGFRAARERLTFERSGNDLRVVNGLGSDLRKLVYREGQQTYVLRDKLPAGGNAKLTVRTGKIPDLFTEDLKDSPLSVGKFLTVIETQPEGSYLAVLESSPFWETGTSGTAETDSFHLLLGFVSSLGGALQ